MSLEGWIFEILDGPIGSVDDTLELIAWLLQRLDEDDQAEVLDRLRSRWPDESLPSPRSIRRSAGSVERSRSARNQVVQRYMTAFPDDLQQPPPDRTRLRLLTALARSNQLILLPELPTVVPSFQFDNRIPGDGPRRTVVAANLTLLAGQDPWGALGWWIQPNGRLGGQNPTSLLDTPEEEVLVRVAASIGEPIG